MRLYWGDLHNHCGITYGKGSLKNALNCAKFNLDFCSVTPHAFWPDMYEKTEETEFLVNFHRTGFDKIKNTWTQVKDLIDEYNEDGKFTTFFSFEMHSCRFGDYCFVSPDRELEIVEGESPRQVVEGNNVRIIGIPHHIAYTPGYRGINWEEFDEAISPVVEVCSKHGSAVSEYATLPYYHDMGPRDPRNTVYAGLARGKRFGFIGSTDHHAGFPGSFGDGQIAVLAESNTRESIWDAICRGRTYAVTANHIQCDFRVNHHCFGERMKAETGDTMRIEYAVEAGDSIDRVVIFRDLEPIHIVDGYRLQGEAGSYKIKIELGWGNKEELYKWTVRGTIEDGEFLSCEHYVRGRNMISPQQRIKDQDAEINRMELSMTRSEKSFEFICETSRNVSTLHPATALLILETGPNIHAKINLNINGVQIGRTVGELLQSGLTGQMKPFNSQAYYIHTAAPSYKFKTRGCFEIPYDGAGFYHMEVRQRDGAEAYVSPVFIIPAGKRCALGSEFAAESLIQRKGEVT